MSTEPTAAATDTEETPTPLGECEKSQILGRYQELVDRKYRQGLTESERTEMEALGRQIDSLYDNFYEPILADLRARLWGGQAKD